MDIVTTRLLQDLRDLKLYALTAGQQPDSLRFRQLVNEVVIHGARNTGCEKWGFPQCAKAAAWRAVWQRTLAAEQPTDGAGFPPGTPALFVCAQTRGGADLRMVTICPPAAAQQEYAMKTITPSPAVWSSASFGDAAETTPGELAALGEHLSRCQRKQSRLFAMHCMVESTGSFLLSRVITTLVVTTILAMLVSLAL
jgi:hypothetical protein